ncbi:MAG: Secretion system C-terminal sorting domain [Bacteroidota bacterium]|jgi:hypothetical protein
MINISLKYGLLFYFSLIYYSLWGQLVIHGTTFFADLNTNVRVDGNMIVEKDGSLNIKGSLSVSGDFIGKGLFHDVKKISFYGNQPSHFLLQNGILDTLDLSKSLQTKTFLLGDSLHISYLLFSKEDNYLFTNDTDIAVSSDITGYKENNFIQTNGNGLIERKLTNFPVVFPVGDDLKGFKPVYISTTGQSGSEFAKVGYLKPVNGLDGNFNKQPVWQIVNNCPIQIHYDWGLENTLNDEIFRINDLRLKGWNGREWELVAFDSLTGNIKVGYLKTRILKPNEYQFYTLESVIKLNNKDYLEGENLKLLPSFPNPFSDETSLNFKLKKESLVTIQIYSPDGQLIKELKNTYPGGYHFEKLDETLFKFSGTYLLVIMNGKDIFQNKVLKINY